MSTRRDQLVGSSLFVVLVLLGWAPYYVEAAKSGIYDSVPLLLGGVFAILAAGLTYDAGERLFGAGKGIYVAAVLTSFPAMAIVFSEPPLLASSSLMFITAATVWFASRGKAENPREALFFIAVLSAIPLALFGFWPPAFLPLFSLLILQNKLCVKWQTIALAASFSLIGLAAKSLLVLDLPDVQGSQPDVALSWAESGALFAPWTMFLLLAVVSKTTWARAVVVAVGLLISLHILLDGAWLAIVGSAAPLLAVAIAAVVLKWFGAETEGGLRRWRWIALPFALVFGALAFARISRFEGIVIGHNHTIIGLLIAVLLITSAVKDARRMMFGLHVVAGWALGALWWYYWQDDSYAAESESAYSIVPWIVIAAALFRIAAMLVYGKRMPRKMRAEGPRHRFDNAVFRNFANIKRKEWGGTEVEVVPRNLSVVRFAIFGDVAGSESPFASRQSGYFAFKQIIQKIEERQPDFSVSTGDLAARATHLAYRRLRMLLRHVPFPLIATPGNHDVVHHATGHPQYFFALFGSDHGDITVGQVRLILINNAWGNLTDEQFEWVEATLDKASTAKSTLVFCHKPVFDPREIAYYGMENRSHAERLHALFVKHDVSAVFSGHIHSLLHTACDGVHYIISGGGGSKLKTEKDAHHYLWCEATEQGVRVTAHGVKSAEPMLDLNVKALA